MTKHSATKYFFAKVDIETKDAICTSDEVFRSKFGIERYSSINNKAFKCATQRRCHEKQMPVSKKNSS